MIDDIRPLAESNNQKNETEFRIAFYRTPASMIVVSPDGEIERVNEACSRLFEMGVNQLCQSSVKDLVSHGILPKEIIGLYQAKGPHAINLVEFKNRVGKKLWLQLRCISPRRLGPKSLKIIMIIDNTDSVKASILASELSSRIIQAHEEEKQLLSQEIHDTICQSLAALKIAIQADSSLSDVISQVDSLICQSRSMAHNLRPEIVGEQGLIAALKSLVDELSVRFKKKIIFKTNTEKIHLPPSTSLQLYRIAQEALTNAGKHANATITSVALHKRGDHLTLHIIDNGKGFDPKAVINSIQKSSLGLKIIGERAKRIGAEYMIKSDLGKGTEIKLTYRIKRINQATKK